jgi:hypothetical protein
MKQYDKLEMLIQAFEYEQGLWLLVMSFCCHTRVLSDLPR